MTIVNQYPVMAERFPLSSDWTKPETVKVEFIGTIDLFPEGVVLRARFNTG